MVIGALVRRVDPPVVVTLRRLFYLHNEALEIDTSSDTHAE